MSLDKTKLAQHSITTMNQSRIRIGTLQPGAVPLSIGITGARRGVAEFGGGARAGVIVKPATSNELAAECFCALLAQELGMRAPDCAIVAEGPDWLFASIDVSYPNLMQAFKVNLNNPNTAATQAAVELIASELASWVNVGRLLAFDVLIQNPDRNPGNLLLDGNDFVLIDHAQSMSIRPYPNTQKIFQIMKACLDSADIQQVRQKAVAAALTFPSGCNTLPSADLAAHALISPFAPNFDTSITNRLSLISSTVNSNL